MNKGDEHHVELLEGGEDATKALQTAKQPLDFIATFVDRFAVVPSGNPVYLGRHDWDESQIQCQLPGFVSLVGPVHDLDNLGDENRTAVHSTTWGHLRSPKEDRSTSGWLFRNLNDRAVPRAGINA